MKKIFIIAFIGLIFGSNFMISHCMIKNRGMPIKMAVEFTDHAACSYISQGKDWFKEAGLDIISYESYATGMALASAMGRGDIQVGYMCLVPAIILYANAKIPIRIVAGTHKYGYGLVVNPDKVKTINDLEKPEIQMGCVEEGGSVDVLLHKIIEEYHLNEDKIIANLNRMSPPKQILAIQADKLDAVLVPEQWATMAEGLGFNMLLISQDVWPGMQGSVLVVKTELLEDFPEIVEKLVRITEKTTDWINENLEEAAKIVTRQLYADHEAILSTEIENNLNMNKIIFTEDTLFKSMHRLEYTTDIDIAMVQDTINYLEKLGYIQKAFKAEEILDLRFLKE
jgi:NitT/TauT family transport system substrate-binding protein